MNNAINVMDGAVMAMLQIIH